MLIRWNIKEKFYLQIYIDKKIRRQNFFLIFENHVFLLFLDFNFIYFFPFWYYLISVLYNAMILLFSLYYDFVISFLPSQARYYYWKTVHLLLYLFFVCLYCYKKNTVQTLTFTWLIWLNILISCFPNYIIFSEFYSFLSFISKWKIMQHPLKLACHGH